jgi:serine protease AprX
MRKLSPLLLALALLASNGFAPTAPVGAQIPNPKISPALLARMASNPLAMQPVILEMERASAPFVGAVNVQRAQAALNLLSLHGDAVGALSIVNAAAGFANSIGIHALALAPGVAYVHEDATVAARRTSSSAPAWPPGRLSSLYPQETHANNVWSAGQGAGITVAVLDSGVNATPDLANRLVASANFADPRTTNDPGGHGTHVAGIVAGNGTVSAGEYIGIAPSARIADVRVLDAQGRGRLSSVIRGIEWVLGHRTALNIRIANLSFGAPPPPSGSYRTDPLSAAIEIAWRRGVAVVVAAGNTGPAQGTVQSPGIHPMAITVGATDDQGSLTLADDGLAWFSSWGTPVDGGPRPDLVAPGRKLVSSRVVGSTLDGLLPGHVTPAANGASMFRLTGTSQATGVVSGAAALVLGRTPGLKPSELKAILTGTTQTYGPGGAPALPSPTADGSGLLNVQAAYWSGPRGSANPGVRPSDAVARTLYPALYGQPLVWRDPTYLGILWNTITWANIAWDNIAWDNIAWDNIAWDNIAWDNIAWDQTSWDNIAWDNIAWDNIAWDNIAWD